MENRKLLNNFINNNLPLFLIIIFAAFSRIVPHPPNIAPIGGLALFSGAFFKGKKALAVPFLAMIISDAAIGFHSIMVFVYGSFFISVFIGYFLRQKRDFVKISASAFVSSLIFFLITNFGVWIAGGLYPLSFDGLKQTYVMAIPFFKNTIIGDFLYTNIFFYSYFFVSRYYTYKASKKNFGIRTEDIRQARQK